MALCYISRPIRWWPSGHRKNRRYHRPVLAFSVYDLRDQPLSLTSIISICHSFFSSTLLAFHPSIVFSLPHFRLSSYALAFSRSTSFPFPSSHGFVVCSLSFAFLLAPANLFPFLLLHLHTYLNLSQLFLVLSLSFLIFLNSRGVCDWLKIS